MYVYIVTDISWSWSWSWSFSCKYVIRGLSAGVFSCCERHRPKTFGYILTKLYLLLQRCRDRKVWISALAVNCRSGWEELLDGPWLFKEFADYSLAKFKEMRIVKSSEDTRKIGRRDYCDTVFKLVAYSRAWLYRTCSFLDAQMKTPWPSCHASRYGHRALLLVILLTGGEREVCVCVCCWASSLPRAYYVSHWNKWE